MKGYNCSNLQLIDFYFEEVVYIEKRREELIIKNNIIQVAINDEGKKQILIKLLFDLDSDLYYGKINNIPEQIKQNLDKYCNQFKNKFLKWNILQENATRWLKEANKNTAIEDYACWIRSQIPETDRIINIYRD